MLQLRATRAIAQPGYHDPLIEALIEKLPPIGSRWPDIEREAWLNMMKTAFVMTYGDPGATGATSTPKATESAPAAKRGRPPKPVKGGPRFFVDEQGYARNIKGERINAEDVMDILYDKRGEHGDLAAIVWADDTRGVKGLHLDISTSV